MLGRACPTPREFHQVEGTCLGEKRAVFEEEKRIPVPRIFHLPMEAYIYQEAVPGDPLHLGTISHRGQVVRQIRLVHLQLRRLS